MNRDMVEYFLQECNLNKLSWDVEKILFNTKIYNRMQLIHECCTTFYKCKIFIYFSDVSINEDWRQSLQIAINEEKWRTWQFSVIARRQLLLLIIDEDVDIMNVYLLCIFVVA